MRYARAAAFLVAVLPILLAPDAHAKASLQGRLTLSLGWTDNILSTAATQGQSDFYATISPALILTTGTARAVQQLQYNFDASLFFTRSEANSYSHQVSWAGFFYTSRSTDLLLTANIGQGRLNTFNLTATSAAAPIGVTPGVATTFVNGALTEQFGWDLNPKWRLSQNFGLSFYSPIDPANAPNSLTLDSRLVIERYFRTDAIGLEVQNLFTIFTEVRGPRVDADGVEIDTVVSPRNAVVLNSAVLKWRHDFGRFWNTELNAGVVEASVPDGGPPDSQVIWQPKGLAAIRFIHDYGNADLTYQHSVAPNALVANTFSIDSVDLRVGLPLGRDSGFALGLAGTYQLARVLDFRTGGTFSATTIIGADGTLSYTPPRRPELSVYARYQFYDQIGNPADIAPLPSYIRHTVLVGISGVYPAQAAAVVPRRQSLRADRSDAPSIPAPHSPARTPR